MQLQVIAAALKVTPEATPPRLQPDPGCRVTITPTSIPTHLGRPRVPLHRHRRPPVAAYASNTSRPQLTAAPPCGAAQNLASGTPCTGNASHRTPCTSLLRSGSSRPAGRCGALAVQPTTAVRACRPLCTLPARCEACWPVTASPHTRPANAWRRRDARAPASGARRASTKKSGVCAPAPRPWRRRGCARGACSSRASGAIRRPSSAGRPRWTPHPVHQRRPQPRRPPLPVTTC